jgi:hypothetical protein
MDRLEPVGMWICPRCPLDLQAPAWLATLFTAAVALVLAGGCTPSQGPDNTQSALAPPASGLAATATMHVYWPCFGSALITFGGEPNQNRILVDGKQVGTLATCGQSTVRVPPGRHAIRIADPTLDLKGLFGNQGEVFVIPSDSPLYLRAQGTLGPGPELITVDAERAKAEMKASSAGR